MKHLKTFESFINEASLPFDIEKELRLSGVSFEFDDERTEDEDEGRFLELEVYSAEDRKTGSFWVIKAAADGGQYYLEIQKDEKVIFANKYPRGQKQRFDQDCMNTLGFLPEL